MPIQYSSKGKIIPKRFTLEEIEDASKTMTGFCLACGAERECCEPDARNYPCDSCGKTLVFGAEEIPLRGYVKS
jgi:hypothetical protein